MKLTTIVDGLWAFLLLMIAPFRSLIAVIYHLFRRGSKRSMVNEIVLVTGAAQGLGREMSIEFAKLGATIVCWDIQEKACQETVEMAKKASQRKAGAHAYVCDVGNREEVLSVSERVQKEVGHVTILVNNAGIVTANRLERYKPEELCRMVNVNLTSHFWMIEAFLPHMKAVNKGQVICIASMSSLSPVEYLVPYSATKCAVAGLMEALDDELTTLGYNNIRLTTVYPFFAATPSIISAIPGKYSKEEKELGPKIRGPNEVAKKIVEGVVRKKREFSIPDYLRIPSIFLQIYPKDVRRACKQVFLGKWKLLFAE